MDRVLRIFLGLLIAAFVSACGGQDKSEKTVFPQATPDCEKSAHKTKYLAKKIDGTIEYVYANSRQELLEKYVRPNLENLEFVEADQKIYENELLLSSSETLGPTALDTWGTERIEAQRAWNQNVFGQGVVVAVVDSGVDINHPNLKKQIFENVSEKTGLANVDDDGNGFVDDIHGWDFSGEREDESPDNHDTSGHGTHVAGIIAAEHVNNPMKGVAPQAKILPLDFMSGGSGYTSDAIEAIDYAVLMGAKIINASWGSSFCSKLLMDAVVSLENKDVLFVTAAGNSGNNLTNYPEYPAAFTSKTQITVGAITQRGFVASFSNYGNPVDLMAPGGEIFSTYLDNSYKYLDGTSMAAPMVSGAAALVLSANPNLSAIDLKAAILNGVIDRNYPVKTKGEVNVSGALSSLNSL